MKISTTCVIVAGLVSAGPFATARVSPAQGQDMRLAKCENFHWVNVEPSTSPPKRAYHAMAYDVESDRIVVFSGDSGPAAIQMYRDTWAYDHNSAQWTKVNSPTSPAERGGHAMSYHNASDGIVLFGSGPPSDFYGDDTWSYDFNSDSWSNLQPSSRPPGRFGHNMAYDRGSDKLILFGGYRSRCKADTWAYDFGTNAWTLMSPSTSPPARMYHSMTYDAESDRIILFGGGLSQQLGGAYTQRFADTWAYDFESDTWTEMTPETSPSPRVYTDMTYDDKCDRVVLFGGGTQSFREGDPDQGHGNETWLYDLNSNTWEQVALEGAPTYRKKHKLAYDSESEVVILFGGDTWNEQGYTTDYQNETWVLEFVASSSDVTSIALPVEVSLGQNYPNPFSTTTRIAYSLPRMLEASLTVYDVLGREVGVAAAGTRPAGWHQVAFRASGLPAGVYLYRLVAGDYSETKRMVILR